MFAFEHLDSGQLIRTDRSFSLLSQAGCLFIQCTHCSDRFLPLGIVWRGQPVTDQVRLEIPFFNSRAAWRGEIFFTMPRTIISSAISPSVPWLTRGFFGSFTGQSTRLLTCSAAFS